jgi:hypothetical protein
MFAFFVDTDAMKRLRSMKRLALIFPTMRLMTMKAMSGGNHSTPMS